MYYPLTPAMSVSKDSGFRAAIYASIKLRVQNLGIKDTITEELISVLPSVYEGI
jgi:hypothetical protein